MKKWFTIAAAAALIAAMAATSMAVSVGDIVYEDDDDDYETTTSLTPGEKYYIILVEEGDYSSKSNEKPKSIKWDTIEVDDPNEDETLEGSKAKKYASISSSPTRLKTGSGSDKYSWGVKLDIKNIKASDYDDAIDVTGTVTWKIGGDEDHTDVSFSIEYEDGGNEFSEDVQSYEFDRNDDVDIDFPDGDGRLVGVANKDFTLLASMDTDYNNTIGNKYPNANLDFYNGNGASLTYIKNCRLHFEADSDKYLYEITDGNKLVDLTSTYDKSKKEFIVTARSLGKYVISDRKLDASSSASGSTTTGNGSSSSSSSSSSGSSSSSNSNKGNSSLANLQGLIERNFKNKFVLLSYGTEYGVMNKAQTFSVAINLNGMDTSNLVLYTYDQANNRLIGSANKPTVKSDGKLYFTTNTKGYYVVSSGSLSK